MGAIHFSIDTGLIRALQTSLPAEIFVETGTFEGTSAANARPFFKKIYTIELSEDYHRIAAARFKDDPAVEVLLGNSPDVLTKLRPALENEPVVYWLDAHWCVAGRTTAGEKSQCPLLRELDAIQRLNEKSAVLIDDARLFLSVPPAPHETGDWPGLDSILRKLFTLGTGHEVTVVNDVIVFAPRNALPAVREYARLHSPDMLVELRKAAQYDSLKAGRDRLVEDVEKLTAMLRESEADRAKRLELLQQSETDRAEHLRVTQRQEELLKEAAGKLEISEADREERLRAILQLSEQLKVSEADRAARLDVIERQQQMLKEKDARAHELEQNLAEARKPWWKRKKHS